MSEHRHQWVYIGFAGAIRVCHTCGQTELVSFKTLTKTYKGFAALDKGDYVTLDELEALIMRKN